MHAGQPAPTDEHSVCSICEMAVSKTSALAGVYKGRTVYFCATECKKLFEATGITDPKSQLDDLKVSGER